MTEEGNRSQTHPGALAWLPVAKCIPFFFRHVLLLGTEKLPYGYYLKKRPGVAVHALEANPGRAQAARPFFDSVTLGRLEDLKIPFSSFDGTLFALDTANPGALSHILLELRQRMPPNAPLACFASQDPSAPLPPAALIAAANNAGYHLYCHWRTEHATPVRHHSPPTPPQSGTTTDLLLLFTPGGYDPQTHARACLNQNRPADAFEILALTPPSFFPTPKKRADILLDMLVCLQAWAAHAPERGSLQYYTKARELFYELISLTPESPAAFRLMAHFCEMAGDPDMANRLLRWLGQSPPSHEHTHRNPCPRPPTQSTPQPPPRILFLMNPRFHYGLDVLYDGLCTVLGNDRVLEYPWKPSLHGQPPAQMANYPCCFNHGGQPCSFDRLLPQLEHGEFDYVLFGDCEGDLDLPEIKTLAAANPATPWFLIDQTDEPDNAQSAIEERLPNRRFTAYFKREMLSCASYPPNTFPLPFAYPADRLPKIDFDRPRNIDLFWAGHRRAGLRRPCLELLETHLNKQFDATYTPQAYSAALLNARIGLNLAGFGFDTVRYWELPAHGALLLSERLPILIPHDFTDGKTALFFEDPSELLDKLAYCRKHPDHTRKLAQAGHAHFLSHHTGPARARQLLGWIADLTRP